MTAFSRIFKLLVIVAISAGNLCAQGAFAADSSPGSPKDPLSGPAAYPKASIGAPVSDPFSGYVSPLSEDRARQLGLLNDGYQIHARYGLIDHDSDEAYQHSYDDQRGVLMPEVLNRQIDERLKVLKSNFKENMGRTPAAQGAFLATAVVLFYRGQPVKTSLDNDTELSAKANGQDKSGSFGLVERNISPLKLSSSVSFGLDSLSQTQTIDTSLSRELLPHLNALIDQKRTVVQGCTPITEVSGQLKFAVNF